MGLGGTPPKYLVFGYPPPNTLKYLGPPKYLGWGNSNHCISLYYCGAKRRGEKLDFLYYRRNKEMQLPGGNPPKYLVFGSPPQYLGLYIWVGQTQIQRASLCGAQTWGSDGEGCSDMSSCPALGAVRRCLCCTDERDARGTASPIMV